MLPNMGGNDSSLSTECWQFTPMLTQKKKLSFMQHAESCHRHTWHSRSSGGNAVSIYLVITVKSLRCGWGLGSFLRWWPPSAMWAGPLSFYGHHRGCLNYLIFLNLGLCAACWAHFMWHHKFWPTSASPTIPIFRLVLQNFAIPGYFPYILFYRFLFSLLSSDWVVIAVCDYFSPGNKLSIRGIVNWYRVVISNDKST